MPIVSLRKWHLSWGEWHWDRILVAQIYGTAKDIGDLSKVRLFCSINKEWLDSV